MTRKSIKFLLLLCVVNTILFVIAKLLHIPLWTVLVGELVAYIGWLMIKARFDPTQRLVAQGSHMGWVFSGMERDENGFRDAMLRRGDMVVRVSWKEKALYIVEPLDDGPFRCATSSRLSA